MTLAACLRLFLLVLALQVCWSIQSCEVDHLSFGSRPALGSDLCRYEGCSKKTSCACSSSHPLCVNGFWDMGQKGSWLPDPCSDISQVPGQGRADSSKDHHCLRFPHGGHTAGWPCCTGDSAAVQCIDGFWEPNCLLISEATEAGAATEMAGCRILEVTTTGNSFSAEFPSCPLAPDCGPGTWSLTGKNISLSYTGKCKPCPENTWDLQDLRGRTDPYHCTCKPGYYGEAGGPCNVCGFGEYKPKYFDSLYSGDSLEERTRKSEKGCIKCPEHSTTSNWGSPSPQNCVCNAGYWGGGGLYSKADPCFACPKGKYNTATARVYGLQSALTKLESGTKKLEDCIDCPIGTYSVEGATSCVICPIGTYAPGQGTPSCLKCPDNSYSDNSYYGDSAQARATCSCNAGYTRWEPESSTSGCHFMTNFSESTVPIAAIIGGVVGGVVVLIIIAATCWWRRRQQNNSAGTGAQMSQIAGHVVVSVNPVSPNAQVGHTQSMMHELEQIQSEDVKKRLMVLKNLLEDNLIDKDEFEEQRAGIIASI